MNMTISDLIQQVSQSLQNINQVFSQTPYNIQFLQNIGMNLAQGKGPDPRQPQLQPTQPLPTPTPTSAPAYRHPIYDSPEYLNNPKGLKLDEMLSAAKQMEENWGVPSHYFMDTSAYESSGGKVLEQTTKGPGIGPVQFEMPLSPDLIQEAGPDFNELDFNPKSATDSADLYGRLLKKGRFDRWGVPYNDWGSIPKLLEELYTSEEINRYIANPKNQF